MKKVYSKPDFDVVEFAVSEAIATCETETSTVYPEQTIQCIVAETDTVFYSGCSSSASQGKLVNYNNTLYYVWYNGHVSKQPTSDQQALLSALGITSPGWHAGPATSEVISIVNASA